MPAVPGPAGSGQRLIHAPVDAEVLARTAAAHGIDPDLLRTILIHAPIGVGVFDADLRFVLVNARAAEIDGRQPAEVLGRHLLDVLPDLPPSYVEQLRQVIDTGTAMADQEVTEASAAGPGHRRWRVRGFPVHGPDGVTVGVAALFEETAPARTLAVDHSRRAELLQRLTAALAVALDTRQVAQVVLGVVGDALDIDLGLVMQCDTDGAPHILASVGAIGVHDASWQPAVDEARATGEPVVCGSRAERDRRYPRLAGEPADYQAWVVLALRTGNEPSGVAVFGWGGPRGFDPAEIELLTAVAHHTAAAVERARLFDAERRTHARLAMLATVSARLSAATSEADRLAGLADALVDGFCDWCTVFLPDGQGRLRRQVVAAADPASRVLAAHLAGSALTTVGDDDPRAIAWRRARPARADLADVTAHLGGAPPDVVPRVAAAVGTGTTIAVPMLARGTVIGVVTAWRSAGRDEPFDAADEQVMADIGRRAGGAVDNLRLLAERTYVASRLQDTLLPTTLPAIAGIELTARYLVAEEAADVGGDLYDAFATGGGYALVVGDVSGRGVDAAGLTGITRAALRALAGRAPVAAALSRLNVLLAERTGDERFVTLAYLQLRPTPTGATLRVWLAGHPPPILVRPDGRWRHLGRPGPPLGLLDSVSYPPSSYRLRPGDTLLAYTDGLVEAHGERGQFGDQDLPALLPGLAGHPAAVVIDRLERTLLDYRHGGADDTALLVARLTPPNEPVERVLVDQYVPATAAAVSRIRTRLRGVLAPLVPAQRCYELLLAVGELLTNAVQQLDRQPPRSPRLDPIHLRVLRRGDRLRVEVANPGPRFVLPGPRPPGDGEVAESGRGLLLVRAVACDLGVTTSSATTCVWFEATTGRDAGTGGYSTVL